MLLWWSKTASASRNHSSNASNFGCVLAYNWVVRANRSMLSMRIYIICIDVELGHYKRVILTGTSKSTEISALFITLLLRWNIHCIILWRVIDSSAQSNKSRRQFRIVQIVIAYLFLLDCAWSMLYYIHTSHYKSVVFEAMAIASHLKLLCWQIQGYIYLKKADG